MTILGRGTGLVGGTIKSDPDPRRSRSGAARRLLPEVSSQDMPQARRRVGLQEIGLPYAADAAITRHLAKFLRQQGSAFAAPTHILFNGGVLRAGIVRDRILETLNQWLAAESKPAVKVLTGEDLMHAVSRGAAYYGLARSGKGVRIRGGIARTYYVGIESSMPAVPGLPAPFKALTVAPFGMEEGTDHKFPDREFGLIVGEPAEFRFFTSAVRKDDAPGDMLEEVGDDLEELSPVEVKLRQRR